MLKTARSGISGGAISRTVVIATSNTTLGAAAATDYVCFVQGAYTITLPTAVDNNNLYSVTNMHTANITVDTTSGQTMNGSLTAAMIPDQSLDFVSDGSNWRIF